MTQPEKRPGTDLARRYRGLTPPDDNGEIVLSQGAAVRLFTHITMDNYRLICIDCGRTLGRHAAHFEGGFFEGWLPCSQVTDPPKES